MHDYVQISRRVWRSDAFPISLLPLCILNCHSCKEVVHPSIVDTTKLCTFEDDRRETAFFGNPSVDCLDLCTIEYVKTSIWSFY